MVGPFIMSGGPFFWHVTVRRPEQLGFHIIGNPSDRNAKIFTSFDIP